MDEDAALSAQVGSLLLELEGVLEGARSRLDALIRGAVPVQDTRSSQAAPGTPGR